jgi:hypothetical protein
MVDGTPSLPSKEVESLHNWPGYAYESGNCYGKETCICEKTKGNVLSKPISTTIECINPDEVICDITFASFGDIYGSCDDEKQILQQGQANDGGNFRQLVETQCLYENKCIVSTCGFLNFADGGKVGDESESEMLYYLEANQFDSYLQSSYTDVKGIIDDIDTLFPLTKNRTIDTLGFGLMIEKCVPKTECEFSLFDQVRLGIRNDGSTYYLPKQHTNHRKKNIFIRFF